MKKMWRMKKEKYHMVRGPCWLVHVTFDHVRYVFLKITYDSPLIFCVSFFLSFSVDGFGMEFVQNERKKFKKIFLTATKSIKLESFCIKCQTRDRLNHVRKIPKKIPNRTIWPVWIQINCTHRDPQQRFSQSSINWSQC